MQLSNTVLTAITYCLLLNLKLVAGEENIDTEKELICPDSNPINCYPKLFIPEKEWKVVHEGQIIPVGLEVRLDLENMKREARLVDDQVDPDADKNKINAKPNHELVVSNLDSGFSSSLSFLHGFVEGMFGKTSFVIVDSHFDELIEWASDIESGVAIGRDVQPLLKLTGLFREKDDDYIFNLSEEQYAVVQEKSYRVLSACFRNNIEAQKHLLEFLNHPNEFIKLLASRNDTDSLLITKRKLGLLGSLLNNGIFSENTPGLEYKLIELYSECQDESVKERIMNILKDGKHTKREESNDTNDGTNDVIVDDNNNSKDLEFSNYIQESLVGDKFKGDEMMQVMTRLHQIKKDSPGMVKVQSEFLNWLDERITEAKKAKVQRRDDNNSGSDSGSGDYNNGADNLDLEALVDLRHGVFGNKLGSRRDLVDDEL